ncbi:MAG: hypothetical protein AAFW73_07260 [Bacteroidota bacterium]
MKRDKLTMFKKLLSMRTPWHLGMVVLLVLLTGGRAGAQDTEEKPQRFFLTGYVKSLQTVIGLQSPRGDTLLTDNLLHQRLNSRWVLGERWQLRTDLRTRIFYGELVKQNPRYAEQVEATVNDVADLSTVLINRSSLVMHTIIDRWYLEYLYNNWEIRLGRQRVNWGISTVWNPNDIFNAFAFTDFDYEERPGSDALRLRYYTGFASSVELAVKAFDDWEEAVAAGLLKWNKWSYDFQVLAGIVERDLVLGGGWAGNIKEASFKGEWSYFHSLVDSIGNSFSATLGLDYSFKNGLFTSLGFLFNSNGTLGGGADDLFSFELSAKNLYPYQWAIFTQASQAVTPLLNLSLSLIYSPGDAHALFLNPNFNYSIAANWDLTLTGQLTFSQESQGYASPVQAGFLRVKYSF